MAFTAAKTIMQTLKTNGYQAFLVGGCVRDLMLGREPKDYDVTTDATPEQVMATFPKTIPVGAAFGVVIVVEDGHQIEVATFRADGEYSDARRPDSVSYSKTAEEDVVRRDFTINGLLIGDALAFDATGGDMGVVDYVGGLDDLKARVIRAIGDPVARFTEDALRMLRAVRFAAQLGFEIEETTLKAIEARAHTIHKVSRERIAAELFKLVTAPYPVKGLVPLVTTGLMNTIMPSFDIMTIRRFAKFQTTDPLKGMAMLLAGQDEEIAYEYLLSLKLSVEQREVIHGALTGGGKMHVLDALTLAELKKLARKPGIQIALDLFEQDCALGNDIVTEGYEEAIRKLRTFTPEDIRPKPLVTGEDLIAMGLTPGPLFTKLLGKVEVEQLDGVLTTREEALTFVKGLAAGA